MDGRDQLKSMLHNVINDKPEDAAQDLHNYLVAKMRDVAGLTPAISPTQTTPAAAETASTGE